MNPESKQFLYDLLNSPSPSGFEQPVQRVVRRRMKKFADSIETDLHGNVIVAINPSAKRRIMLAGHCDQIGFMVKHITACLNAFTTQLAQASLLREHLVALDFDL